MATLLDGLAGLTATEITEFTRPLQGPRLPGTELRELAERMVQEARCAFRQSLAPGRDPPRLLDVRWGCVEDSGRLDFCAYLATPSSDQICWRFWLHRHEVRSAMELLANTPAAEFQQIYRQVADEQRRSMYATAPPPQRAKLDIVNEAMMRIGIDPARPGDDLTAWTTTYNVAADRLLVEAPNMTATEVDQRFHDHAVWMHEQLARVFAMQRPDWNAAISHDMRRAVAAEARSMKLLRRWLSPKQLAEFEAHGHFEVIGGVSGARYRIKRGEVQNVFELDGCGREICGWCFAPDGNLVAGDVMLAQKVALECNERAALKVANGFEVRGRYIGGANYQWYDELAPAIDLRPGAVNRVTPLPERLAQVTVDSRSWTGRD